MISRRFEANRSWNWTNLPRPRFSFGSERVKANFIERLDWRWLLGILLGLALGLWLLHPLASQSRPYQIYSVNLPATASNPPASAAPSATKTDYALMRSPTISPARIDEVLRQYKSPAIGSGQAFYNLGLRYGIDPAYALAFFIHESSAGTQGVAAVTRSIGNIRCTSGYDCYQTQGNGAFRRYSSWEAGVEDWYKLIRELYIEKWGLKNLSQIIPVYAPSADRNNPATYIQQVASLVDSWG